MGFVLLLHEYTHKDYEYISTTFVCMCYLPTHCAVSTIPMNKIPLPNFYLEEQQLPARLASLPSPPSHTQLLSLPPSLSLSHIHTNCSPSLPLSLTHTTYLFQLLSDGLQFNLLINQSALQFCTCLLTHNGCLWKKFRVQRSKVTNSW